MTGQMVVPASLVFGVWVVGLGGLVTTLWSIIDAAATPHAVFVADGRSKRWWITTIALLYFFTWMVGIMLAIVYLSAIRPKLRAQPRAPGKGRRGPSVAT